MYNRNMEKEPVPGNIIEKRREPLEVTAAESDVIERYTDLRIGVFEKNLSLADETRLAQELGALTDQLRDGKGMDPVFARDMLAQLSLLSHQIRTLHAAAELARELETASQAGRVLPALFEQASLTYQKEEELGVPSSALADFHELLSRYQDALLRHMDGKG